MKKQIFTILILLMGSVTAFGQFKFDSGTNSLRLQTGGVDRMYIAPPGISLPVVPGNVGIGTIFPNAKLTIVGDMALQKVQRETVNGGYNNYDRQDASIAIFQNGGTLTGIQSGFEGQILYVLCGYGTSQSALTISHESASSTASNRILTHTGADFIIPSGLGGVLLIYDAIKARWRIVETPSGSGTQGWSLTGNAATTPATQFIGTTDVQDFSLRTNNLERMRVLSGGNIGIGTASPARLLHLSRGISGVTSSTNAKLFIEDDTHTYLTFGTPDNAESGILFGKPTGGGASGGIIYDANRDLQFRTSSNDTRMVVTEAGNVGIGTTTPQAKLEITGDVKMSRVKLDVTTSLSLDPLNRQNNSYHVINFVSSGETVFLRGISAAGNGTMFYLIVAGTGTVRLQNDNATNAANRLLNSNDADITITNNGSATYIYDTSGWRLLSFTQ